MIISTRKKNIMYRMDLRGEERGRGEREREREKNV